MGYVVPVNKNNFQIKLSKGDTYAPIANMESFEISFDANTETWSSIELHGLGQNALKTGIALSLSFDTKRTYGDAGSDELWSTAYCVGEEANRDFKWTMADGTEVDFTAVVAISSLGGDANAVETMSVELTVVGVPTITEKTE
jgi:hypothetical protein